MHTVTDFLKLAGEIVLTIALIAIGVTVYNRVLETEAKRSEKNSKEITDLENDAIMKYDGMVIHGGTIVSYIKEIEDDVQTIKVVTQKTPAGFYVKQNGTEKAGTKNLNDYDSVYYIAPMSVYKVDVTLNANKIPESVTITYKP